jgi:hypothetical protein
MAVAVFGSTEQFFDNSGEVLAGGTVEYYEAETTTPLELWLTDELASAATNPAPLNSAGRQTQGMLYFEAIPYKAIVKNSSGSTILTLDNIDPGVGIGSGALPVANGGTGATTAGAARTNLGVPSQGEVDDIAADVSDIQARFGTTDETEIASGTTAQRPAGTAGALRYNSTLSQIEAYLGAWLPFLGSAGVLASVMPADSVVKSTYAEYLTNADLATQTPIDDTIPQIGEGNEIISVSFTPTNSSNLLRFRFQGSGSTSSSANAIIAHLHKNADADAIAGSINYTAANSFPYPVTLEHQQVAGTTSATTYSIRVGSNQTIRMNGNTSARRLGGVAKCTLVIEEIKV